MTREALIVMNCKCPWTSFKSRQQYLALELVKYFDVLYLQDGEKFRPRIHMLETGLYIGDGILCWYDRAFWHSNTNYRFFADMAINQFSKRYRHVVIWNMENCHDLLAGVKADIRIFDHIDPCFSIDSRDVEDFNNRVAQLCEKADVVVASAPVLAADCMRFSDHVHLVKNACIAGKPFELSSHTKNIDLVWLGTLDNRIDTSFVRRVCEALTGKSVVFAGNMHSDVERELRSVRNLQLLGPVTAEEGNNLLSRSKYGMIPYNSGYVGDRINPVKLFEYIAHDVVPICLPNRSVDEFTDYVFSSDNVQVWSSVVTGGILPKLWDKRHLFLSQNTWAVRGIQVQNLISRQLGLCVTDE